MAENKPIKAAGYVRVSSSTQVDNESLSTQRQSIRNFCKANGYKLTEIYADEGISGGSVKERHGLLQCLHDGRNGKFDVLVIHRLSRFGRNARELLNNHEDLQKAGIHLRSISEGIDFGNKYGKAMLGMFAIMAELERDIIREQMLENRIARSQKGIPSVGKLPFGRTFNRETMEWELDDEVARLLQWTAEEYLKGGSLRELSETLRNRYNLALGYHNLIKVLTKRCGSTWSINFKGQKPIEYEIPRILDDETIERIKERLEHNKIDSRKDVRKYALTGFIRCEVCGKSLSGQTQINRVGSMFQYYNHPGGKYEKCKAFNSVPLQAIEKAVFLTIFENIADMPAFEQAIKESLPDEQMIMTLEKDIKSGERELTRITKELGKLVDLAMSGTLKKETIQENEEILLQEKSKLFQELEEKRERLNSLPNIKKLKEEADAIRRDFLLKYSGKDRLDEMSFDDKKALLHWLFDGKDDEGTPYGIYVNKRGKGHGAIVDYFLFGRITGIRTMKGDDIDYQDPDDENNGGQDNDPNSDNRPNIVKRGSYRGNKVYKTSSSICNQNNRSYIVDWKVKNSID